MYHAPDKLRYRYAKLIGPLFNEGFILRFEVQIYSDRHAAEGRIMRGMDPEISIHAPQQALVFGTKPGRHKRLCLTPIRAVPPTTETTVRTSDELTCTGIALVVLPSHV
jgi:hypothetical protein